MKRLSLLFAALLLGAIALSPRAHHVAGEAMPPIPQAQITSGG